MRTTLTTRIARRIALLVEYERFHRPIIWAVQVTLFALSGISAFLLRFDLGIPREVLAYLAYGVAIWIVVKTAVFRFLYLDRGYWQFVSIHDVFRIAMGNLIGSAVSAPLILILAPPAFPRSLYLLDFLICYLTTTGARIFTRLISDAVQGSTQTLPGRRVLIYGAGSAGGMLLREIRTNPRLNYAICGFIDDNDGKRGIWMQGVRILGSGADLAELVKRHTIEEVLIAIPSADGPTMTRILDKCHLAGVRCKTIPGLSEVIKTSGLAAQIRDVAVEDLLGRTPIDLDEALIRAKFEDRVVMVTGAAGSIGSELCRQIMRFRPRALVGFEIAETPLFHLAIEMRESYPDVPFYPEIGSIQKRNRVNEVLRMWNPVAIFHAAAYKHVPMMESNIFDAVENNVLGTYDLAQAAREYGVATFVMISSDKAVHPTSIMGATKRIAELFIHSLQGCERNYVSVRFGNVLGSNGSVVPLFKHQIAAGGPVTVTHPDMRRFFMTIPESARLVLQASAMGKGGEIFVLDMGQSIKIVDLARNLILLSGLRPDIDIAIEFIGVRPGEKMFEELSSLQENTVPTYHEKIKIYADCSVTQDVCMRVETLRKLCGERDAANLILELKDIVPEYNPSAKILQQLRGRAEHMAHSHG